MSNRIQTRECASYYHCARSCRQQTNPSRKKHFPSGWKCYKTIGSYVSCAFIEIWSTWEVWRALKKLELLSATPRAILTHLSCSPNFPRASYLDERTLTYESIVNLSVKFLGVALIPVKPWTQVWSLLSKRYSKSIVGFLLGVLCIFIVNVALSRSQVVFGSRGDRIDFCGGRFWS